MRRRKLTLLPLVAATYFMVSGGPYGLEELVQDCGYRTALLIIVLIPLIWSLPTGLMVGELAAAMPLDRKLRFRPGRSKVVLKRAFADLLPKSIRTRRKMGFGVPVGRWFQDELKHELRDVVLDRSCLDRGLFRPDSVRALVADHLEGRREHGHRLWALVMLELWFRNHIDGSSSR